MKTSVSRRVLSVLGVSFLSFVFSACKKTDNMANNVPVSGFMAVNLANDKAVNITYGGIPIMNTPLTFSSYTGGYLTVYPGSKQVQTFDFNSNEALDSSTFNFEPQKYYSLFVTGTNGHYKNVIVNDNFDSVSTNQAQIRYVNAIADSAAPTVTITAGGSKVVESAAPFTTVSDFTSVAPGDITIKVNNGGTINKSRTITLAQQTAYTILLAGIPGSAGNDSLQIRYITNGTLTQKAQKSSSTAGSEVSK